MFWLVWWWITKIRQSGLLCVVELDSFTQEASLQLGGTCGVRYRWCTWCPLDKSRFSTHVSELKHIGGTGPVVPVCLGLMCTKKDIETVLLAYFVFWFCFVLFFGWFFRLVNHEPLNTEKKDYYFLVRNEIVSDNKWTKMSRFHANTPRLWNL